MTMHKLDEMAQANADEKAHALATLREMIEEGQEIGTVVIHGRGLTDHVECFTVTPGTREIVRISYYVARVCGYVLTEQGIVRKGGGYDKAHDVVDSLSRVLFGEGNKLTRNRLLG